MPEYENEVQERWGHTGAFNQFKSKSSKYSKDDFQAAKVDQEAATELFVYAYGNSLPIDSERAQAAVVAHREVITKWIYECSVEMQLMLGRIVKERNQANCGLVTSWTEALRLRKARINRHEKSA